MKELSKPWAELKVSKEDVIKLWKQYESTKNEAEQYMFTTFLMIDLRYEPLYNDLMNNWDEYHAQMFVYAFDRTLKAFVYGEGR